MNYLNSNASPIVTIKVMGIGGGGNNAVNRMIASGVEGAYFVAVNTDKQTLLMNRAETRLQIGEKMTKGQGAGSDPEIGQKAAEESEAKIREVLEGTDLLFITAGMGGGTGTGAAPIIAKIAKDMGIITVAVVTKPFDFEGPVKMANAEKGIESLKKYVDTIMVIPNAKLSKILPKNTTALQAFMYADDALRQGIQGISDIITKPNMIKVDFADIKKVVKNKGVAHMGVGRGKGENKMLDAIQQAIASPLLETSIEGATGLIYNIRYCVTLSLFELDEASDLIRKIVSPSCNIIHGDGADEALDDEVEVTVIATGFEESKNAGLYTSKPSGVPFGDYNQETYDKYKQKSGELVDSAVQEAAEMLFGKQKETKAENAPSSLIKEDTEDDDEIPPFLKRLREKK